MQLADHPGDELAYRHFRLTELCRAMYPQGAPAAADVSREMAAAFTARGIVRTLRHLRGFLDENPEIAWSVFTEDRFTDMLRAAAEFELSMSAGTRLADFAAFLGGKRKRSVAEPGKIKIMTIHRSKGLGFDYVVLPLYEYEGLEADSGAPLVGDGWVLPDPGARVAKIVGGLEEAYGLRKQRVEQETLCTYYVAMTRAKSAMTVILHPQGQSLRFSDIVRSADIGELGGGEVVGTRTEAPAANPYGGNAGMEGRPPRREIRRRLPSLAFGEGESAGSLFADAGRRRAAADQGIAAHAEYERIEWLSPSVAKTPFERALVKPDGCTGLWRERAFEIFADGAWTSGRFDRVVFVGVGEERRAFIYDFKTNRLRAGESVAQFEMRMAGEYFRQMESYRKALGALAKIPVERISATLLLAATQSAVAV
jgi:hypothetical protein